MASGLRRRIRPSARLVRAFNTLATGSLRAKPTVLTQAGAVPLPAMIQKLCKVAAMTGADAGSDPWTSESC